ncbi:MAG: ribosome-associated translation inhibitor RaiA [Deltaproteobacteria bacterium]|nr:ribosome-associated translation inhibitor RaiA [Deltaproteobacteria bacterium]MBW2018461.1 ribosome-associated translation inhibitor RaiA [Deltaproteobacteria bacterium]MBW2074118.1 ribosome-associated translation inhibitor RaiA [Deltaproteobacteria bacterium]RLB83618.1 MAG: ribosome-associated translation inhibitor RaiA [Deltaproteobacteria bacterium]
MQTSVTFINLDSSETLKAYACEKLDRFDKYLENPARASVVLTVEKFRHIADINISADGFVVNGHEETADMYSAIDMALDKLEKQIKKNKEKFKKRRSVASKSKTSRYEDADMTAPGDVDEGAGPRIARIKNIEYKPMDVDEAVLQMNLINDSFLVFTNAQTEEVNVLYRLKDGNYGLIQPRS